MGPGKKCTLGRTWGDSGRVGKARGVQKGRNYRVKGGGRGCLDRTKQMNLSHSSVFPIPVEPPEMLLTGGSPTGSLS